PTAQQKVDAQKLQIAQTETELAKASKIVETKTPAIAASAAPSAPSSQVSELTTKLEKQTAELAKLREIRSGKQEGTAEYADANGKVQSQTAEIAQTETAL